jgi:cytoskeletal protein CcmA (bactofilin family)
MEKSNRTVPYSILEEGVVLEGALSVPHSVRIAGTLKGKLETSETVTIAATGVVEADIRARSAIVGGRVIGNLIAEDRVELESTASLTGDLRCRTLVINEGASFQGKSAMGTDDSLTTV